MGRRARWILFASLTAAIVACGSSYTAHSEDDPNAPEAGADVARLPDGKPIVDPPIDGSVVGEAGALLPSSCVDAQSKYNLHSDGNVQIDLDGDGPMRSFVVYCDNMATSTPKEYLELKRTPKTGNPTSNFSMWGMGGYCPCAPNPKRSFDRVRLHVPELWVNTTDLKFSTRTPAAATACEVSTPSFCQADTAMNYAEAASCVANGDSSGTANIDLRDTPFHIHPAEVFIQDGAGKAGGGAPDLTRKTMNMTGGGACGYFRTFTFGQLQLELDSP